MSRVTFLMAVHNGMPYLPAAVESMRRQSVPCRILIVNDASTDDTGAWLETIGTVPEVLVITNDTNLGLAASLNRGLGHIDTEYVARLDSDDIARSDRLEKQLAFMDAHPDIGISGGWARIFGNPKSAGIEYFPSGTESVHAYMLFGNPICHPTVIIRNRMLKEYDLNYDSAYGRSEDLDLWMRASAYTRLDNMRSVLTDKRDHPQTVTTVHSTTMATQACALHARLLKKIGVEMDDASMLRHWRIGMGLRVGSHDELRQCAGWIRSICDAAARSGSYDAESLTSAAGMVWWRLCANSTPLGLPVWSSFFRSGLNGGYKPTFPARARFVASILWHLGREKYHVMRGRA